ncbi:MAG: cell envelope integrity protein CreD [Pseudomonadota bacterium]
MKNPYFLKIISIFGVSLILWALLAQINNVGTERKERQFEAQQSVEASQAEQQTLVGPVIQTQCTEEWTGLTGEGANQKSVLQRRDFTVSAIPTQLAVDAKTKLEPRYRGIFKVNTYAVQSLITAEWTSLKALRPQSTQPNSRLSCGAPYVMTSVSDARGIRRVALQVNGQQLAARPGSNHAAFPSGFHAELPEALRGADQALKVSLTLDLIGTGNLSWAPVAESTQVKLASDWPHPSFAGRFLPVQRDVRTDGFKAEWQISALATTAPKNMVAGAPLCTPTHGGTPSCIETFSVSFVDPVNTYSLSDRAMKYGLLFVGLTFIAVGLVEALRRLRVHPIQYLFVGCALSIFFFLLLSLSEHLAFNLAYGLAATACVTLLTVYGRYLLQGWAGGLSFGAGIGLLYGCLFVLLQLEQAALVMGSLMLFGVLAVVMLLTRKLDWYALLKADGKASDPAPLPNAAASS